MNGYALVNETGDTSISWDLTQSMARVLTAQGVESADWWERRPLPCAAAESLDAVPKDPGMCIAHIVMQLDDPEAMAYHTIDEHGRPVIRIGWGIIQANGGTLTGANSLLTAISHELREADQNPYCGWMVALPDGSAWTPVEVCDDVEGDSYEQEPGLYVSNFVGPRYFDPLDSGSVYDRMRLVSSPFQLRPGGYRSILVGGPQGSWTNVWGAMIELGGMPQWKRTAKLKPNTRGARIQSRFKRAA